MCVFALLLILARSLLAFCLRARTRPSDTHTSTVRGVPRSMSFSFLFFSAAAAAVPFCFQFCFLMILVSIPASLFDVAFAAADSDGSGTIDEKELERLVNVSKYVFFYERKKKRKEQITGRPTVSVIYSTS